MIKTLKAIGAFLLLTLQFIGSFIIVIPLALVILAYHPLSWVFTYLRNRIMGGPWSLNDTWILITLTLLGLVYLPLKGLRFILMWALAHITPVMQNQVKKVN